MFLFQWMRKIVPGGPTKFRHTFGGKPRHKGAVVPNSKKPLHLLLHLNLSDPLVSSRYYPAKRRGGNVFEPWRKLGIRWLPIYYSFQTNDEELLECEWDDIQYIVKSDAEIKILAQLSHDHDVRGLPVEVVAPECWPERSARLVELSYEEMKTVVWAQDVSDLSQEDSEVIKRVGRKFHQWGGRIDFADGPPRHTCMNRRCPNYGGEMDAVGALQNKLAEGEYMFDKPDDDGADWSWSRLIIEVCSLCTGVTVSARFR